LRLARTLAGLGGPCVTQESPRIATLRTFYGITDDATGIGSVDGQNLATAL